MLSKMLEIRLFEEKIEAFFMNNLIGGTVHEHLFSTHYNSIHVCETASDVHCVIAFDTWRGYAQLDNSIQSARKPLKPTSPGSLRSKVQKWANANCKLIDANTD